MLVREWVHEDLRALMGGEELGFSCLGADNGPYFKTQLVHVN